MIFIIIYNTINCVQDNKNLKLKLFAILGNVRVVVAKAFCGNIDRQF